MGVLSCQAKARSLPARAPRWRRRRGPLKRESCTCRPPGAKLAPGAFPLAPTGEISAWCRQIPGGMTIARFRANRAFGVPSMSLPEPLLPPQRAVLHGPPCSEHECHERFLEDLIAAFDADELAARTRACANGG